MLRIYSYDENALMIKFKSGGVFLIDFYKMCPIYHKTFGSPFQLYPYPLLILHANVKEEIDQVTYLKKLLDPIRDQYDYIFIDVPPTISDFSDNAMMAADYVLIILQTQELSLEGTETYIKYLQFMADNYDDDIQVVGVLPVRKKCSVRITL